MQIAQSQKVASLVSGIASERRAVVAVVTFSNRDHAGNDASVTEAQLDLILAKIRAELETYGVQVGACATVATFPATTLEDGETLRLVAEATLEKLAPDPLPEIDETEAFEPEPATEGEEPDVASDEAETPSAESLDESEETPTEEPSAALESEETPPGATSEPVEGEAEEASPDASPTETASGDATDEILEFVEE